MQPFPVPSPSALDPYESDYRRRQRAERAEVQNTVQRAVAEALAGVDENRIVIINLTVQYASGGGATNIVGDDPRPNGKPR